MIADIRFQAANLFVASLLRTSTSIWWGGRVVMVACQLASGRSALGADHLHHQFLGNLAIGRRQP